MNERRTPSGIILPSGVRLPEDKVPDNVIIPIREPKHGTRPPKQKDARILCRDYGADGVVIFYFTEEGYGTVTAGRDQQSDKFAKAIGQDIMGLIKAGIEDYHLSQKV